MTDMGCFRGPAATRRAVLGGGAALLVVGPAPDAEAAGRVWARRIRDSLGAAARRSAAAVGAVVRRSGLFAGDPGALALRLAEDLDPADLERPSALREGISRQVRRDFAAGAVTTVDGWTLSETEARLAALVFALETGGGRSGRVSS